MKKYITTAFTKIALLFIVLCTTLVQAQDPTDLPDAPDDTNSVPIDDYVWILAGIGLVYVFLRIRAFTQNLNSKNNN
jgi:hypothetical protein